MASMAPQWTAQLRIAQLRADPSGAQGASTEFQAGLLSGMSTITHISQWMVMSFWHFW
jgi:hypothetical protein